VEHEEREQVLLRILSAQEIVSVDNSMYIVEESTIRQKLEADILCQELAYDLSFEGWLTKQDTIPILTRMQLWSPELDERLKLTEKNIDDLKVSLYKSHLDSTKVQRIKKSLAQQKQNLETLLNKRSLLDHTTLENYLSTLRTQYLIALSILDNDGEYVYNRDSFWYADTRILFQCMKQISKNKPSPEQLRELSRTEPWRSFWNIGKDRVFKKAICDWTSLQRTLALYSKMYDNAYSHPECPHDEAIEDDDMFDGWVLIQDTKRKKQIAEKGVDNVVSDKAKNAAELFLPAKSLEDRQRISNMNDLDTRVKLAQRNKQIKNQGLVKEGHFADQQLEFRNAAQKATMQRAKGGRK
jgi:hypothetical protein